MKARTGVVNVSFVCEVLCSDPYFARGGAESARPLAVKIMTKQAEGLPKAVASHTPNDKNADSLTGCTKVMSNVSTDRVLYGIASFAQVVTFCMLVK